MLFFLQNEHFELGLKKIKIFGEKISTLVCTQISLPLTYGNLLKIILEQQSMSSSIR